ncbi:DDE-type integrase/transposase/recombinase [Roseibium sp. RKSG952]|uniref:DDE-type integrase/transposase/recombinase n=1 Tax=Roseibium sp. RKSG952 TaxID=2529384 RepID=UPI0013C844EF|nr:hypothetical protein [Roseibium sp. RKSG952]
MRHRNKLLDRNFDTTAPDTFWLADISHISTDESRFFQVAVKDLWTMEVVGWSMSDRLKRAIMSRRPTKGLIHHSDRGAQYACGAYQKLINLNGMTASMSPKRKLSRQCTHGEFLRCTQDRDGAPHPVQDQTRS